MFTRLGVDQVSPPSWDLEKAIADPEGARVASCHTRYADRFGPAARSNFQVLRRFGIHQTPMLDQIWLARFGNARMD